MKLDSLESEFLDGEVDAISSASMTDLRARRERCVAAEAQLSLLRRVVHGRLDILQVDVDVAADDGQLMTLLRSVPELLADTESNSRHQVAHSVEVSDPDAGLLHELDLVCDGIDLGGLAALPEPARSEMRDRLVVYEARLSTLRHSLHRVVDAIQAEVGQRYRNNDVDFPIEALT